MSTINAALPDKPLAGADAPLDEVMLAMDVVDTLRHDAAMLDADLGSADREADLIARLREIYSAQGIEVPDHILKDGVAALEDERFSYSPPKPGLGRALGKFYIHRKGWGVPLMLIVGIAGFAWSVNYAAIEMPAKAEAKSAQIALSKTLPNALKQSRDRALSIAKTPALKTRANGFYDDGMAAVVEGDVKAAKAAEQNLTRLAEDLNSRYAIRIVSRPGEDSGVSRLHAENRAVENFYLIVEAIAPDGKVVPVMITSEEDQKTKRTTIWGVRVPETVFERVAADKMDDQIINEAIIGAKARGYLEPKYSIETSGSYILKWRTQ
ncbi:MAG: DUF6384 family protein [Robiginitomaculum sp.]